MRVPVKAVVVALAMLFGALSFSMPSNAQGFATGGIVVRDGGGRHGGFHGRHDGFRRDGRHYRGGRYQDGPRFYGNQRSYRDRRYHGDRRYSDRRYYNARRFHERGYHGRHQRRSGGGVVIQLR